MPDGSVPYGRKTQHKPPISEVHVLWITAGLGCDGDTVSITAASLPSIEDILLGAIPGLPKVHLHNPVLAYETNATGSWGSFECIGTDFPAAQRSGGKWERSSRS